MEKKRRRHISPPSHSSSRSSNMAKNPQGAEWRRSTITYLKLFDYKNEDFKIFAL
jgi:hypothetical protein